MVNANLRIFLGCGLGGLARFWVSNLMYAWMGKAFPIGTLVVNVTGSLLMGFLFIFVLERFEGLAHVWRPLLLIGFLGGYTTFSSFSIETFNLIEAGHYFGAVLNVLLSVALCLIAAWLGVIAGRQL